MLNHSHPYLPTYIVVSRKDGRLFFLSERETYRYVSANHGDIVGFYLSKNGRTIALPF